MGASIISVCGTHMDRMVVANKVFLNCDVQPHSIVDEIPIPFIAERRQNLNYSPALQADMQ